MNECLNISELIQKELDEELTTSEIELLEKHCEHCFSCQELRQSFYQTIVTLENLPELELGDEFTIGVMAAIQDHSQQFIKQKSSSNVGLTGLVAGLVLVISSGIFLVSALIISLILGGLMFLNYESIPRFYQSLSYGFNYGFSLIRILLNNFTYPYSFLVLSTGTILSMTSFIVLVISLYSRRTVNYEDF